MRLSTLGRINEYSDVNIINFDINIFSEKALNGIGKFKFNFENIGDKSIESCLSIIKFFFKKHKIKLYDMDFYFSIKCDKYYISENISGIVLVALLVHALNLKYPSNLIILTDINKNGELNYKNYNVLKNINQEIKNNYNIISNYDYNMLKNYLYGSDSRYRERIEKNIKHKLKKICFDISLKISL